MMAATQKSSKKRPASTQAGPTPKKAHLAKPAKGKESASEKKRSRPVTLQVQDESSEDEDDFGDFGGAEDETILDEEVAGDEMDVHSSNAPKDPNGMSVFFYPGFALPQPTLAGTIRVTSFSKNHLVYVLRHRY